MEVSENWERACGAPEAELTWKGTLNCAVRLFFCYNLIYGNCKSICAKEINSGSELS